MGYSTRYTGEISVVPPLREHEITYLSRFAGTRRMRRVNGPYYVGGTGIQGQGHDADILDYNEPPEGQPDVWCCWVPTSDGTGIRWNGMNHFYDGAGWMQYLIDHFIGDDPTARRLEAQEYAFLQGHRCNGTLLAQGDDSDDRWLLVVRDNRVSRHSHPPAIDE
jgi:hypothetical protein